MAIMVKALICGSRHYDNYDKVKETVKSLVDEHGKIIIIEGGAKGADTLAKNAAIELGIEYREYKADWKRYGRAAGPKRNQLMLDTENPDLVIAFHEDLESGKGTKDMLKRAEKAGVKTIIYE